MLNNKLIVTSENVIIGRGLVAIAVINPGEVLWEPDPVFPLIDCDTLLEKHKRGDNEVYSQVDTDLFARNGKNARCYNHCCMPNSFLQKRRMIALTQIQPGEEITYDYGLTEVSFRIFIWCCCGSKNCRTLVLSSDYLNARLVAAAQDRMPEYVRVLARNSKKIDRWRYTLFRNACLIKRRVLPSTPLPFPIRRLVHGILPDR